MEVDRQSEGAKAGTVHRAKREAHGRLKKVDKELMALTAEQPTREAARQEAAAEKLAAVRRRAKAELDVKELQERLRANSEAKVRFPPLLPLPSLLPSSSPPCPPPSRM